MNKHVITLMLTLLAYGAQGEQILKLPTGEKYLGLATSDQSGIFVDCQKVPHRLADGEIQPTSATCEGVGGIYAWDPTLITISPLVVVSVDPKKKQIEVREGETVKYLDLHGIPPSRFTEFTIGSQIGVVADKKRSANTSIVTEAIFDKDFAVDAKDKQDKSMAWKQGHPDAGAM
ncbi:hypothetical protein [Pseudomonas sp. NPDC089534]|uniref:hypothetical protein n=1 Tax=Pseudomonas sp. NPDC089534 TaxID=3364468 RepID=UPI003801B381